MLLDLKVKDFGIIEEIDWSPGPGLNVITGETGAGKSLVVDAIAALLSGKLDEESIRHGAAAACLEGVFALPPRRISDLQDLLAEKGLAGDEETLLLSAEFRRKGRSALRVNRQAVPRALMGQLGRFFIDIHGQSEHLSLLNKDYHLDFLDAYAHSLELRHNFAVKAAALAQTEHELKSIIEAERDRARREEFLRFQIDEIKKAKLTEGEDAELEKERNILASCEKLKSAAYEAYQAIYGEESAADSSSALERLNRAIHAISHYVEMDTSLKPSLEFLENTARGLADIARDLHAYSEKLAYDPARLEEIEARRELILSLLRKYGQTIPAVLEYQQQAERELAGLVHSTERRSQLEALCDSLKREMGVIAAGLSQKRSAAAEKLTAEVEKELKELGMAQVKFAVAIAQEDSPEGIPLADGKCCKFSKYGVDNVEFLAATNPGEPLKPLAKIASTGEISRFMLALKSALSEADNTPVLIFDEIDIGVGGRSGEVLGKKLWKLARNRQVICVTHLPQIAVFADAHFTVHKETAGNRTLSRIEALDGEARLKEIAAMLSGVRFTETARENARELLGKAQEWQSGTKKKRT
ncbi:MAG: DNA repair protein RecN [Dehalococcoidales bacterium]|nr:DNA repair protein RecN [Dehalococcoidales bacterium]